MKKNDDSIYVYIIRDNTGELWGIYTNMSDAERDEYCLNEFYTYDKDISFTSTSVEVFNDTFYLEGLRKTPKPRRVRRCKRK